MSEIGVGLIGYRFMGRTHSNAYRQVAHFFDVDPAPRMVALCGRDAAGVEAAAGQLGWESWETDYQKLIARPDIQLVDVASTGRNHYEAAMAALAAGKHVYCEKPLANSLGEAREMALAAEKAGVINLVNFNYRYVPAVQLARKIIAEGKIGAVRHWRSAYLQDWINDPEFPLVWRMDKALAGSGALGDIAAHSIDLARFLVGDIAEVTGSMKTFITERPVLTAQDSGLGATGGPTKGPVTVDDSAHFLARFTNGATGTFEVTRLAPGRKNYNSFEINGERGSIVFNLERLNELQVFFTDDPEGLQGFRTINVTEASHPYTGNWWPAGHIIGYEHTFVHIVKELLDGIRTGVNPSPSFREGYEVQAVLDAVERSAESGSWTAPEAL